MYRGVEGIIECKEYSTRVSKVFVSLNKLNEI